MISVSRHMRTRKEPKSSRELISTAYKTARASRSCHKTAIVTSYVQPLVVEAISFTRAFGILLGLCPK